MENLPLINLVHLYSLSGRIALWEKKMADHRWILEVLDDLSKYALKNNIPNLETNIRATAISAKVELAAHADKKGRDEKQIHQPFGSRPN